LSYLWRAAQENVYVTKKQISNDVEQASFVVMWAITIVVALLTVACGGGLAVRVFLWASGV